MGVGLLRRRHFFESSWECFTEVVGKRRSSCGECIWGGKESVAGEMKSVVGKMECLWEAGLMYCCGGEGGRILSRVPFQTLQGWVDEDKKHQGATASRYNSLSSSSTSSISRRNPAGLRRARYPPFAVGYSKTEPRRRPPDHAESIMQAMKAKCVQANMPTPIPPNPPALVPPIVALILDDASSHVNIAHPPHHFPI